MAFLKPPGVLFEVPLPVSPPLAFPESTALPVGTVDKAPPNPAPIAKSLIESSPVFPFPLPETPSLLPPILFLIFFELLKVSAGFDESGE